MTRGLIRNRKTPFRHRVKEHKRLGRPVQKYMRGKGKEPAHTPRHRHVVGVSTNPRGNPGSGHIVGNPRSSSGSEYDVRIFYTDARSERYSVDAKDYPSALTSGLGQRSTIEPPRMIRMRRAR